MTSPRQQLSKAVDFLDDLFALDQAEPDSAFSQYVPMVYDAIGFDWRTAFEPEFGRQFNGLMLRGAPEVRKLWLLSFPETETLSNLLDRAQPGDLIFSHHPIDMRCGDPHGGKGAGFIPMPPELLRRLIDGGVSFYSCHAPLDLHQRFSTSGAIVNVIGGERIDTFYEGAGILCSVAPTTAEALATAGQNAIGLPYLDVFGDLGASGITRVAVLAGSAGQVRSYQEADRLGAGCLLTGEITARVDDAKGAAKQAEIEQYRRTTRLTAIGLSHAGSEFLVMKELAPFFERELGIETEAVPEDHWWR